MYSFGIRGKQFQYVEGKLPEGFPFHGRMTDHDVRNLQGRGAEVIVLDAHYTADDLKQARDDCRGETGKTPNQADPKTAQQQVAGTAPTNSLLKADNSTPTTGTVTQVAISSAPTGADIEVDGNFVGNTPSAIHLPPGDHTVTVSKNGYKTWERKMKSNGGDVNVNVQLEAQQGAAK